MRLIITSILLASAFATGVSVADAKPRKKKVYAARPFVDPRPVLTVNRRSFLDPGPVVPVGTESSYVTINTVFNRTPDQVFSPAKFGNSALPRPLDPPGRNSPIVEFETPGYPNY